MLFARQQPGFYFWSPKEEIWGTEWSKSRTSVAFGSELSPYGSQMMCTNNTSAQQQQ